MGGLYLQSCVCLLPAFKGIRNRLKEVAGRIDGMAGYETRIDATSGKDNTSVTIVQWLKFGGPGTLRIIGSAPRDQWSSAFPRFRAVRDGIQPKG